MDRDLHLHPGSRDLGSRAEPYDPQPRLPTHRHLTPNHHNTHGGPYGDSDIDVDTDFDIDFDDRAPRPVDDRHAFAPVSPDDFYKSYRPLHLDGDHPDTLPMASSSSVPRPSLRSNGDGSTARHPPVSSSRNPGRTTNLRSASNPVDDRPSANPTRVPASKTSVKDLKKRFDQNGAGATSIPRAPARPGAATRVQRDPMPKPRNGSATPYSTLRSGSAQDSPTESPNSAVSPRPGRSRFAVEDQVSNNAQSFASRISKPRSSVSSNPNASKSMTNLAHRPPPPQHQRPTSPQVTPRSQGLLFGEILAEERDTSALGFGIESLRPRRTSEANLQHHQRSLSDPDIEPSSPSHWYRSVDAKENGHTGHPGAIQQKHSRSQSDAAASASPLPTIRHPTTQSSNIPSSATSNQPGSNSKLPLSVRKLSTAADSPSPPSTRSNSPNTLKRSRANGRTSRTGIPTASAKTPTSRAETPTQASAGRKHRPDGIALNSSNRLQANIVAPPPKLSPPLRSSRPRQPVSMASTASSRLKAIDRARSPSRLAASRAPAKPSEPARRRKISVGPIDFEQRREHIRLAYSKSIRESQALEARQRAAENRRKDMEAAAKAKAAAAEAAAPVAVMETYSIEEAASKKIADVDTPTESPVLSPMEHVPEPTMAAPAEPAAEADDDMATPPLTISTGIEPGQPVFQAFVQESDSPTLGVPGSFPATSPPMDTDEPPRSAISTTSGVTEFDGEAQTNAPTPLALSPLDGPITVIEPPTPQRYLPAQPRAEYQYPFRDEPDTPEKPIPSQQSARVLEQTRPMSDEYHEPAIPGAFTDDCSEHDDSPTGHAGYEATVTILPPPDGVTPSDESRNTIPFPRLDPHDESDCQSETEDERRLSHSELVDHDDATTDACTEDTDDHDQTDRYRRDSRFDTELPSQRASTCESSDGGALDEPSYSGYDEQYTADTTNSLLAPPGRADRYSQQTAWTDYTVDTADHSDTATSPAMPSEPSPSFGHVTIFESPGMPRDSESSFRESRYSSSEIRPSVDSSRSSAYMGHQLPELDPGGDFSIPYLSPEADNNYSFIPSPNHEPPPVPTPTTSALNSRRTSSAFYDQSQYGSTLMNSERDSEDYMSRDTPSLDATTLGTPDLYSGGPTPADSETKSLTPDAENSKERRRLVQRRNVIKELVDTEAVFVRDMNIVEEIYKGTAEACPKLDDKTVKLIFRNSEEIIEFHTTFLAQIKGAVASVYIPKGGRAPKSKDEFINPEPSQPTSADVSDEEDYLTSIGPVFKKNMEKMKVVHEAFLRNSDHAAKKLIQIQQDPTVKVWLNECNEVAKDLTAAWDLDSLLIKPMQRITKYPNLIITLLQHTPQDHPDREELLSAKDVLETAIIEINQTKKNFELVGQIVGRKRKESDVKAGFARAFGKRVDKLQASSNRPTEDAVYAKLNEKFGDDYLRLQVVLRDVEFYTRQVSAYVHEFLQYLSSIELVMRLQPGSYPELESKWVQFNISVRDLEKVALEEHLSQVRKKVIEPFEAVIKAYGNPSLAMKKRQKRRLDYERYEQLKHAGKSIDSKLKELVEHYEALNDTLKKELPMLSALTEKVGNICLGNFVNIQTNWFSIWKDKMKTVLGDSPDMPDLKDIVSTFQRDYPYAHEQFANLSILNPTYRGRASQSTTMSADDALLKVRSRPSDLDTTRGRGLSTNGDMVPSLPTPDFAKRNSETFSMSPSVASGVPSPHQYYYKDFYSGIQASSMGSASPMSNEVASSSRSAAGIAPAMTRPSTGRSYESSALPRQSSESAVQYRRDSSLSYTSPYLAQENRRYSGLFHSALPLPDEPNDSLRSSRASSRERAAAADGYNVLWLAASLFEFNIATTKHEAGYPYLIYQAGEIFDVIAEKGELWLAKNQDDAAEKVGWIWSKHFAKLADS